MIIFVERIIDINVRNGPVNINKSMICHSITFCYSLLCNCTVSLNSGITKINHNNKILWMKKKNNKKIKYLERWLLKLEIAVYVCAYVKISKVFT